MYKIIYHTARHHKKTQGRDGRHDPQSTCAAGTCAEVSL